MASTSCSSVMPSPPLTPARRARARSSCLLWPRTSTLPCARPEAVLEGGEGDHVRPAAVPGATSQPRCPAALRRCTTSGSPPGPRAGHGRRHGQPARAAHRRRRCSLGRRRAYPTSPAEAGEGGGRSAAGGLTAGFRSDLHLASAQGSPRSFDTASSTTSASGGQGKRRLVRRMDTMPCSADQTKTAGRNGSRSGGGDPDPSRPPDRENRVRSRGLYGK